MRNPTNTANLTGVTQVSAGAAHTCARLSNAQARCWDENGQGRLGDGTIVDRLLPAPVETP